MSSFIDAVKALNRVALITGITGQDGSYLAEFLLSRGYEVHGIMRRSSSFNTQRIDHIFSKLNLHFGDVTDGAAMNNIIRKLQPDEIYHMAAQSHVKVSFELPTYTSQVDGLGTLNILDAIHNHSPHTKMYNATTSELFGNVVETPQKETTPFNPQSPYAVAKLYSYWISLVYRKSYDVFVSNGILFNHESERRGHTFVTRKITLGISKLANDHRVVKGDREDPLQLGNLDAKRDWGYAPDYVEGMWRMLQYPTAEEWVLSTGETHSIREFVNECISHTPFVGRTKWVGEGIEEKLMYKNIALIKINPKYYRPSEVDLLVGDSYKAKTKLGWVPETTFTELVYKMMKNDLG